LPKTTRLDALVLDRRLAASRERARALILAGQVRVDGQVVSKAGAPTAADARIELAVPDHPYVGRGGVKLAHALEAFAVDPTGRRALDVGASTGGFTDCVLQAGAADVVCVDVGRAQLHAKLRADPRVTNLEKLNARHLSPADLPRSEFDLVVMDLSFISLTSVLPAVWPCLRAGGTLVALVKPQFEAGKAEVDKGRGVIRNVAVQEATLAKVRDFALAKLPGARLLGTMNSPITGADGNREFLLGLKKDS
jgi:23S rRNA (cytidine1920-2'-O)/16S rRNA (cytidine1409-2'-O)-methyltransferase